MKAILHRGQGARASRGAVAVLMVMSILGIGCSGTDEGSGGEGGSAGSMPTGGAAGASSPGGGAAGGASPGGGASAGGEPVGGGGSEPVGGGGSEPVGGGGSEPVGGGGSEPVGGGGSGSGTAEECPVGAPMPAAGQVFVFAKVDVGAGVITLRNATDSPQQLSRDAQLCDAPWCVFLADTSTDFAPGEELSFDISENGSLAYTLSPDGGEVSLHEGAALGDPSTLRAYVAWGSGGSDGPEGQGQEPFAVSAGLWVAGERAALRKGDAGFVADGPADRGEGYLSVSVDCL